MEDDMGDNFDPRHEDGSEDDGDRPSKTKTPKVNNAGWKRNLTCYFYRINDSTLLYKFTLIEVTLCGTQLKCLEQDCSAAVFKDTDYAALFEKMAAHVDQNHLPNEDGGDSSLLKTCPFPVCNQVFQYADKFRQHLLSHHKCKVVVCEICWRPQRIQADLVVRHKWSHRNDLEKLEVPPPRTVLYQARRCITGQGRNQWLVDKLDPVAAAVPKGHSNNWKLPQSENFTKLSEKLLLYKYTLIKGIPGGRLSCLEPECSGFISEGTDYDAFEEIKAHVKDVHLGRDGESVYTRTDRKCPLCSDVEFTGGYPLRAHIHSKEHGYPPYVCHCCWKPVKGLLGMRQHLTTHQTPSNDKCGDHDEQVGSNVKVVRKFVCGVCGKEFVSNATKRRHVRTHLPKEDKYIFSCDQCPKKFSLSYVLKRHVDSVHLPPDMKTMRSCPICNQQFPWGDKNKFEVHMRTHSNEKPFVCDQCGKAFVARARLTCHQKNMHPMGEGSGRRYQCEFCEMDYKNTVNLRRHQLKAHRDKVALRMEPGPSLLRVLPENRPGFIGPRIAFPCEICEKVFRLKCRLSQHMKKYH